jgi:hypothetical protein
MLVQYLLDHNIIEDVIAVDKSSYMIALVFRRQKNVNITLEFWDIPSTPKKIIISHKVNPSTAIPTNRNRNSKSYPSNQLLIGKYLNQTPLTF